MPSRLLQLFLALLAARKSPIAIAAAPTHYEVLGLPRDASQADVKKMYKQLARQYHPDKNPAEDAQKKFIEIQKAYEVLSDPARRQRYDSSSGFWSDDDERSGQEQHDGPPDFGRGVVLADVEAIRTVVRSEDLWLLHVYIDNQELFGSWMAELPEEIHLGHVNVQRDEELLLVVESILGGRLNSAPLLVLCQKGRHHHFSPSFHSIFFGLESAVTREVLHFVDYWKDVTLLYSDETLRSFMEFQPGGSSRLRLLFVLERSENRQYDIFSASMRLRGLANVAQLGYYDTANFQGEPGPFLRRFGLRQLPAIIVFDPLVGSFESMAGRRALGSGLDIVRSMINGKRVSSRIYPIQELDLDSYKHRCGAGSEKCDWIVVLATSAALEKQSGNLQRIAKMFSTACERLESTKRRLSGSFACFWLRLGRAPAWDTWLRQHDSELSGTISYAAFSASRLLSANGVRLRVAPSTALSSSSGLFKWCEGALTHNSQLQAPVIEDWPPIPPVVARQEELHEPSQPHVLFEQYLRNLQNFQQIVTHWLQEPDAAPMLLGCLTGFVLLCIGIWKCSVSEESGPSLQENLSNLELWVIVKLCRADKDAKLGFGIGAVPSGRIRITEVFEGGLLEAWNAAEPLPERRVKAGDEISAVHYNGTTVTEMQHMARALKQAQALTLTIVLNQGQENTDASRQVWRLFGGAVLEGLTLNDCAQFRSRADGSGNDLEIVSLRPPLIAWNELQKKECASCTTLFDIGDRVVAVNGNANVQKHMDVESPSVIIVKWRSPDTLRRVRFDVDLERSDLNESWGFHLRMYPGDSASLQVMPVVRISIDGLLSRWNHKACANDDGGRTVRVGDRLVMVNGMENMDAIRAQLRKAKVRLSFERWHGDVVVPKGVEVKTIATPTEIEEEPEPDAKDEEHMESLPTGEQTSNAGNAHEATTTAQPSIGASEPPPGMFVEQQSSSDGWDCDFDSLLADSTVQNDALVDQLETIPPEMVLPGALPNQQNRNSELVQSNENSFQSSANMQSTAHRSVGKSPRLREPDMESLRLKGDGLVILCARGSEEFVAGVEQLADMFRAQQFPITFCHEAQMPMESLLIMFPRHSLCRCLHFRDSTTRDGDLLSDARSIIWQSLAGDVSLLKQGFDPLNINGCWTSVPN